MTRRKYRPTGVNTITVKLDSSGLNDLLSQLEGDIEEAVRPAAQAGAQVLYDDAKANVARIKPKTGNLAAAIYQVYSKTNSTREKAVYHVSWNASKAPHGHLIEYGHIQRYQTFVSKKDGKWKTNMKKPLPKPVQIAAKPFMRPVLQKFPQAYEAVEAELLKRVVG